MKDVGCRCRNHDERNLIIRRCPQTDWRDLLQNIQQRQQLTTSEGVATVASTALAANERTRQSTWAHLTPKIERVE